MDPTIQLYKRQKDNRKAWLTLYEQHVGKDKRLTKLIKEENLLNRESIPERPRVDTPKICNVIATDIVTFE